MVSATRGKSGGSNLPFPRFGTNPPRSDWGGKGLLIRGGGDSRAARQLLTLEEKDPKRLFEGNALIRRLVRVGVLDDSRMKLDYVLALSVEDFLERRLQVRFPPPPRPLLHTR